MISAIIITPICWLKTFNFLSYVSMFSNCSILFGLITIMVYSEKEYVDVPKLHNNIRYIDLSNLPLFFGIAVFNFEGNGVILNINASMKEPEKFEGILRNVMIALAFTLIIFGCATYEAFGYEL